MGKIKAIDFVLMCRVFEAIKFAQDIHDLITVTGEHRL